MIVRTSDDIAVLIRLIAPGDKRLLVDALGKLSEDSVHKRFLAPKASFTASELRYLTEVDGVDHFALVAVRADDLGQVVAVARFVRLREDPLTADFAIVVADEFQGQGLGGRLAHVLADAALERGVRRFSATMLTGNRASHRLMQAITARLAAGPPANGAHELIGDLAA